MPHWAVQRPRVSKLVAEGTSRCPLTVVTGPPGAGKTMALALWAAAERGPVAWVCLDQFDNQPSVFWSYVAAALRRADVAMPKALHVVPHGRPDTNGFLPHLTAVLAAQAAPVTLVLDDLHVLTEPSVLKGLEFLLRNAGPGLRLVVASRMDPLLPLHRYRLAGQLAEIRASDLAFSSTEAGLLLAQHGSTLTADLARSLTQRTEGWAAGLRLAAISLGSHPDPGQFVKELIAEDSALIGYLVEEVLNVQPPEVREVLLSTSILEHLNADAAVELTGDDRAAGILTALVHTNAFVQPIGSGWYRYHGMFAEMLRLKLRHERPGQVAALHRRAAQWYERNGMLTDAVRHAIQAGDWQLAAGMVIDDLAIGQLIEPRDGQRLAGEFMSMRPRQAGTQPAPLLVAAALALAAGQHESCVTALDAADAALEQVPADEQGPGRLAAAAIRLGASLGTGDLITAAAAASRAELMLGQVPAAKLARHPELERRIRYGRGAVELWSGHLDEAARIFEAGLDGAGSGGGCGLTGSAGQLALAEALRGRLGRAAELAGQATLAAAHHRPPGGNRDPAPMVALAWVHVQRSELREARSWIKRADAALGACPDKLIGAMAYLVAADGALAEGRAPVAVRIVTRARSGWPVPAWLDQQLSLAESRACAAAGDIPAAVAAAKRADTTSPEAMVTLARAWVAGGDAASARRVLDPVLDADDRVPDRVRVHALLVDARLAYSGDDGARGRRSLASALHLAEREQLRLPFLAEQGWLGPVLGRDPELAASYRRLFAPAPGRDQLPAPAQAAEAPALVVEPLTEREREVLVHLSGLLSTAEVASAMYISVNTVKTHLRSVYRKLAASHRNEAVRRARQLGLI
ncbi:MAG TPA: LuxR C-terminal-related transcriptional regulator [Streptosporangiaceae bacterium]|nr:LuxR C-terminal-related transcriptional regulator [Streptosporangiaceae bacterium]